ncbi:MAG TPA: MFS transporter [Sphingobium sp.]|nr:MFS transporter [Sphingobium sp.]
MAATIQLHSAGERRRALWASLIGTSVEFYDFFIYATAASLYFGPLFFPAESPAAQLLAAYASLALAFFARPVGAIVFGHFGDRIGRKATLVASLLLMGISTFLIAFLPTHAEIGWWAALLLCMLRLGQGLGLGGEWGGASLLAVENAPKGWRGRYGIVPPLGAPIGFITASGAFLALELFLTTEQMQAWGWRIPFLGSALLVVIGLWVRLKLAETPAFAEVLKKGPPESLPLTSVLRNHPGVTIFGMLGGVACFAAFYMATAFLLGYGTLTLGYSRNMFLMAQIGGVIFMAVGIILSGIYSDRFSPRAVLIFGCLTIALLAGPLMAPMMESGSIFMVFLYLSLVLLCMGLAYGPLGAWLPGLFPARVRYTGVSLAFNFATIVGGGLAPYFAQTLAQDGGIFPVGLYLSACGVVSLLALLLTNSGRAAERWQDNAQGAGAEAMPDAQGQ